MKKKKKTENVIEVKTVNLLREFLWLKNYQQRNVFKSNGGGNEKLFSKLTVPKFQK